MAAVTDVEEQAALTSTLSSFYHFHRWQRQRLVTPRIAKFHSLSPQDQHLLSWFPKYVLDLELCIDMNQQFTQELAIAVAPDWDCLTDPTTWLPALSGDYEKVKSTLLQMAREWSDDGEKERAVSYTRFIDELTSRYPSIAERQHIKVLVPGCGLGRLVWELVRRGFSCQGNEFTYHMLLASSFMLNHCPYPHSHSIFPYLDSSLHVNRRAFQLRPVTIPDADPSAIFDLTKDYPQVPVSELMSMTAGSFTDLYGADASTLEKLTAESHQFRASNKGMFDAVCTCFFLDTAANIIEYLRTVANCLSPKGTWINFGPLLWHFEHDLGPDPQRPLGGLELTRQELHELVKAMGFEFERQEADISSTYTADPKALGAYTYQCEYWVCKRE